MGIFKINQILQIMLIKVSSKCTMQCPHCMDNCKEDGVNMTLSTFKNAVSFGTYLGSHCFVLSGGEPTENPLLMEMCRWLDAMQIYFSICSNGMWLKSSRKTHNVEFITKLPNFLGMQVFTHKDWYKEYSYICEHKQDYEKFDKVNVEIDSHIYMQDLGRASVDEKAQKESELNPYHMSCLNSVLVAKQVNNSISFCQTLELQGKFCKPSVDTEGYVHMSESKECPFVGNVNYDQFYDIWYRMKTFKPCGSCKQYKKFLYDTNPMIVKARELILNN